MVNSLDFCTEITGPESRRSWIESSITYNVLDNHNKSIDINLLTHLNSAICNFSNCVSDMQLTDIYSMADQAFDLLKVQLFEVVQYLEVDMCEIEFDHSRLTVVSRMVNRNLGFIDLKVINVILLIGDESQIPIYLI
ncbi:hypothetical protein CEXT_121971 [Caerostris extrusa]|uniref:Uncharacterized protein n=1 Tax=Caerostris extrusa TaxID=172846 RepID=A0AAV4XT20_CAEEX|nr:hypothetical protein CEXT_121971 [Caerostris extrusa]